MITETLYKDRPAAEVRCDNFSALFLAKDGAKMASFKTKDGKRLCLVIRKMKRLCISCL